MSYLIIDEPKPSKLEEWTVNPIFPMFAFMFGSPILSWAWSVFNGYAMGSPHKKKALIVGIMGMLLTFVYLFALGYLLGSQTVPESYTEYLYLGLTLLQLCITYYLYFIQNDTFDLFQYFGGVVKNGFPALIVCFIVGRKFDLFLFQSLVGLIAT